MPKSRDDEEMDRLRAVIRQEIVHYFELAARPPWAQMVSCKCYPGIVCPEGICNYSGERLN